MKLKVAYLQESESSRFYDLAGRLGAHFSDESWIKANPSVFRLGVYRPDGQLIGGCTLQKSKLKGIPYLSNPLFAPNCGLFFINEASKESRKISFEKGVIEALLEWISKQAFPLVEICLPPEYRDTQAATWKKFRVVANYTYRLDLNQSEEELWNGIDSSRRNRIRKLESEGHTFSQVKDPYEVAELVSRRLGQKGVPFNQAVAFAIVQYFMKSGKGIAFSSSGEDQDGSIVFAAIIGDTAYYLFGGTSTGSGDRGASLLLWELIKATKRSGASQFDFEGSMVENVERYFRSYGGQITPYFRIKKASMWMEALLRLFKRGYWN